MKRFLLASALSLCAFAARADDLGVTAQAVYDRVQQNESKLLFVDVRDPVEIMFVGFTDAVHVNVPYLLVDRNTWDEQRGTYKVSQNPNFLSEIRTELKKRGLDENAEIITMCRSGSARGKPSADYLLERGFTNVKYIDNGFQGSTVKDGEKKGFRVQNGWQNSGLPWSTKANPEKIYRFPASGT